MQSVPLININVRELRHINSVQEHEEMLHSTAGKDCSEPQYQDSRPRPKNCARQSEAFDKLRCRQHHQGTKDYNAVTKEKVERGVTGDHAARAKAAPLYD